jgi:hypothetical protein
VEGVEGGGGGAGGGEEEGGRGRRGQQPLRPGVHRSSSFLFSAVFFFRSENTPTSGSGPGNERRATLPRSASRPIRKWMAVTDAGSRVCCEVIGPRILFFGELNSAALQDRIQYRWRFET